MYYVGANAAGKPVLYREWHRGPHLPAADPGGSGGDVLTEAVQDSLASLPLDPDYRTPWHALATLDHASYGTTGGTGTLQIALKDTGLANRPTGMSPAEAKAAVQQLVYTAQAAIGKRAPVVFTIGRKPPGGIRRSSASTSRSRSATPRSSRRSRSSTSPRPTRATRSPGSSP